MFELGCIILLLAFPFITIPSIIYGITPYFLFPISFFLLLFVGKPSGLKVSLLSLKLTHIVLIAILPIVLYFFTWKLLGVAFFIWMLIYYMSRFYTGAHEKEVNMVSAWTNLESFIKRDAKTYIKNNPVITAIIIVLTLASLIGGYFIGGLNGLFFGIFLSVIIWWLTPYSRETIKETNKEVSHGQ